MSEQASKSGIQAMPTRSDLGMGSSQVYLEDYDGFAVRLAVWPIAASICSSSIYMTVACRKLAKFFSKRFRTAACVTHTKDCHLCGNVLYHKFVINIDLSIKVGNPKILEHQWRHHGQICRLFSMAAHMSTYGNWVRFFHIPPCRFICDVFRS